MGPQTAGSEGLGCARCTSRSGPGPHRSTWSRRGRCQKLGLCLGKPDADLACPELGQLDRDSIDDGVQGGIGEGLTTVDSRLGAETRRPGSKETRWPLPRLALILLGVSMLKAGRAAGLKNQSLGVTICNESTIGTLVFFFLYY